MSSKKISKQEDIKPLVFYTELAQPKGRQFFEVTRSESPLWPVGTKFSDDDMSMGSKQVLFIMFPA